MPEPNKDQNPDQNIDPAKPTFTQEQQDYISNNIVKERLARQAASLREEFKTTLATEIEKAITKAKEAPIVDLGTGDDKDKAAREQHKALLEQEQAKTKKEQEKAALLDKQLAESRNENERILKHNAITKAMKGIGFHSPEEVEMLIDRHVEKSPDGKGYVIKENGVVKENASLEPMTLAEYLRDWASARPYSVDSSLITGAGSTPGNASSQGQVKTKADLKNAKEKSEYIKKFGYDAFEKLPLGGK
jgi:hypothetical protein